MLQIVCRFKFFHRETSLDLLPVMAEKKGLFKVVFWGASISLLGALPLGTLNMAAMQVSISEGWQQAVYFSGGVALVEILYVRLSVAGVHWIMKHAKLLRYMEWGGILIVAILALASIWAGLHPSSEKSFVLQSRLPNFLLGMTLSAVNPLQIPFWFGWTSVLFSKGILHNRSVFYNVYMVGIGLGTLLGLGLFIAGGHYLVKNLTTNQALLNLIIGGVFAITAVVLTIKIFIKKPIEERVEETGALLEAAEKEDSC